MNQEEILNFIKKSQEEGKSKEKIYLRLLENNVTVSQIEEAYSSLKKEFSQQDTQKRTIQIVVAIGAVLIGAGIFSFIASNWETMSDWLKVTIILVAMIVFYLAGWHLRQKVNYPKTGAALIFLGAITYGAGIFLVAQIFNIRANWPDGFVLWMLGVIVLTFATEIFYLFLFAIALGIIAIITYPLGIITSFGEYNPFIMTSSWLLLIATISAFACAYFIDKKLPGEFKKN